MQAQCPCPADCHRLLAPPSERHHARRDLRRSRRRDVRSISPTTRHPSETHLLLSSHRFVNHSLANLNQKTDVNPFALREPDMSLKGQKIAFDRNEAASFVEESREMLQKQSKTEA